MKKYKKYEKHLRWLNKYDFHIKSYGNNILFMNEKGYFDRLTPVFFIDIKNKSIKQRGLFTYLMYFEYFKHIIKYCESKYGFTPVILNLSLEEVKEELFFPIEA